MKVFLTSVKNAEMDYRVLLYSCHPYIANDPSNTNIQRKVSSRHVINNGSFIEL